MIISSINREQAIVTNIRKTLSQMKQGGKANIPLVLNHPLNNRWDISFYTDAAKTNLLFSENGTDNSDHFTAAANRTLYTPPDEKMNFAAGVSEVFCQPKYYVTATFHGGDPVFTPVYRNLDNLVFQNVIVTTKDKAKFTTNENTCMIYPRQGRSVGFQGNDDLMWRVMDIDLYLQLNLFNWANLSEEDRWSEGQNVGNLIRNALYDDPNRDGNCTLINKDIMGTDVGDIQVMPSDAVLKAKVKVQCAFYVSSTTY